MDAVVARYSQPTHLEDEQLQDEEDLSLSTPPLSLKFALPPIGNVSTLEHCEGRTASSNKTFSTHRLTKTDSHPSLVRSMASCNDR